ncbi:MAG TPA: hypothetical protein VFT99_05590 [Roseiflexaceae bacterium]|nr:hypothetical protein [Roseiflexaceae bacterium]
MAQQMWEISGKLQVEESDITGVTTRRPLANVEVEVMASNFGVYASWGEVRTNSDGEWTLRKEKDKSKRKFKIKARFADSELEVNTGLLANIEDYLSPAIVVFEHDHEVEGPDIQIGTRCFKAGASGELGELTNIRQAITWYLCKTVINTMQANDSYFSFDGKIHIVYPSNVVSNIPYANGVTRCAYIQTAWWSPDTVLHEMSHLWNYDHNYGTANWIGAVLCPPDFDTHSLAERRPIAFHEGFAEYAAQALLHEIWGNEPNSIRERPLPYSRNALVESLHLHTRDEVEQSDQGVFRALALLTSRALYKRRFGDKDTRLDSYPYAQAVSTPTRDCPEPPRLTIWDVLKVFQANPGAGWPTEWQVGNNDYGVVRFFERAADVLPALDEATKDLMLNLIDPNGTLEPQSRCESSLEPSPGGVITHETVTSPTRL